MTSPTSPLLPTLEGSERERRRQRRDKLGSEELRQAQRMKTSVRGGSCLKRYSHQVTEERRENAIPRIRTPAMEAAIGKAMPKDERNGTRKPGAITVTMRMVASQNAPHLCQRISRGPWKSQVGGVRCRSETPSPRPTLQLRTSTRRSRDRRDRTPSRETLQNCRNPRRKLACPLHHL